MYMDATSPVAQAISIGVSQSRDPADAAREFHRSVWRPNLDAVLFFCSPQYDLESLARELGGQFGDTPLVGCTTAGEITPRGYIEGSITGFGLPASDFVTVSQLIDDLKNFTIADGNDLVQSALAQLDERAPGRREGTTFAFLMIDGVSQLEESIVSAIFSALGEIPLLGGSAGDDLSFERTFTFKNGRFHDHSAILVLIHTRHPFRLFKTEHFQSTECKMVVTDADSDQRIVRELNAEPAAQEYARVIGIPRSELNPVVFAAHPLVVKVGGEYHVRSIQRANVDDSLSFLCAIDEGIVLTAAKSGDIVEDLARYLTDVHKEMGDIQIIIGCDCILRRLEIERKNVKDAISRILLENKVIGFSTYGEQYNSMHVNQSFTGVAIGYAERP
jgi:hypothetical protein